MQRNGMHITMRDPFIYLSHNDGDALRVLCWVFI